MAFSEMSESYFVAAFICSRNDQKVCHSVKDFMQKSNGIEWICWSEGQVRCEDGTKGRWGRRIEWLFKNFCKVLNIILW